MTTDDRINGQAVGMLVQPELYRIREAAAVLAVSPRMVYAFIEAGELTPVRLPGSGQKRSAVRIARADLLSFVAKLRGRNA
jgi:excisionase family DNA binding protein